MQLMQAEWTQMQNDLGITDTLLGQLLILLEDGGLRLQTLLTQLMYSLGICEMTFSWREFYHPEYTMDSPAPNHMLESLRAQK
eukprot:2293939-Rhodomonas_salina.2